MCAFFAYSILPIRDAYFATKPYRSGVATTYLTRNLADSTFRLLDTRGATDSANAVAGAAITVLEQLYTQATPFVAASTTFQLNSYIK